MPRRFKVWQQTIGNKVAWWVPCCICMVSLAHAQVTSINSSGLGTAVVQNGNVYEITGGTRVGSNLFHSFGNFSIAASDMAQFQSLSLSPDFTIGNILSRVTGGNPSSIFGTIDSATFYPAANLFLMNPAGIIFGPNATLNVGGMATFTTADYLRLTDGVRFEAIPSAQDSLLSAAPVAAFGFLGSNPGAITVQGSQLMLPSSTGLSLVGGDVTIGADVETGTPASIMAPSGEIRLAGAASPGELLLPSLQSGPNMNGESFMTMARVAVSQGAFLDVSGDGSGTIRIRGGEFVMDGSVMMASSMGSLDGAPAAVDINVQESATITNGSAIFVSADSMGRAGDIQITGENIHVDNGSALLSFTGDAQGGNVSLTGHTVSFMGGSGILTDTIGAGEGGSITISASGEFTISGTDLYGTPSLIGTSSGGDGNGGSILINAGSAVLTDRGLLDTGTSGPGRAGDIAFQVNDLDITGGAGIQSSGNAIGSSGDLTITADAVLVSGLFDQFLVSRVENSNASGPTGAVSITARQITVTEDARINNESAGTSGGISMTAADSITISRRAKIRTEIIGGTETGGSIELTAPLITMDQGLIQTKTVSPGDAGPVRLIADTLIIDGAQISTEAEQGFGRGGDVTIEAEQVTITGEFGGSDTNVPGPAGIFTRTFDLGNAGDVLVTADTFAVGGGAQLNSNTSGTGNGGNLTVLATNEISISGAGSGLFSETSAFGDGGDIHIQAPQAQMSDGAVISAQTTGSGAAGSVSVNSGLIPAQSVLIAGSGSGIFTDTQGTGAGGNITMNANSLTLQNGGSLSATTSGSQASATGGAITIDAGVVQINNGTLLASTTGPGNAGAIAVNADAVQLQNGSRISSESVIESGCACPSGSAGNVSVHGRGGDGTMASSLLIDGSGSGIFTDTQGTGAGGNITVNANTVTVQNGGRLSAATSGTDTAPGGTIMVNANHVHMNNGGLITASTTGAGVGGSIEIQATHTMAMTGGSSINADSAGTAEAGSIQITATEGFSMQNSSITTSVTPTEGTSAGGGDIKVTTAPSATVYLQNSTISASVADGPGGGGNISIDPQFVILQNSQILAQAAQGTGGNILIVANLFLPDATSVVNADSGSGVNGTVNIQSPISQAGGKLSPLPNNSLINAALLTQRCAAIAQGNVSSFTVAGRDALPIEPGGWLTSPLASLSPESGATVHQGMPTSLVNTDSAFAISMRRLPSASAMIGLFGGDDWLGGCGS